MKKQYKTETLFYILIFVFILFMSAFSGQASSSLKTPSQRGEGSSDISGYQINVVDYILMEKDPTKVKSVILDVSSTFDGSTPGKISVSFDGGNAWVSCVYLNEFRWESQFKNSHEPLDANLSSIRIVATQ